MKLKIIHRDKPLPVNTETGIEVTDLGMVDRTGKQRLKNLSFSVKRGEILGVAGVAGNGQTMLLEVLSGITPPSSGSFTINGQVVTPDGLVGPAQMRDLKVQHVPEDRLKTGFGQSVHGSGSSVLGINALASSTSVDCFNYGLYVRHVVAL